MYCIYDEPPESLDVIWGVGRLVALLLRLFPIGHDHGALPGPFVPLVAQTAVTFVEARL